MSHWSIVRGNYLKLDKVGEASTSYLAPATSPVLDSSIPLHPGFLRTLEL